MKSDSSLSLSFPYPRNPMSNSHRNFSTLQYFFYKNLETEMSVGQIIHGFKVTKIKEIKEFSLTAISLRDINTNAEWLHLQRDDKNNLFSIGFNTSVSDSTGVPHILEHTVLCGSKKYPVRDPFFKMLNRSMSTFMNAWTGMLFCVIFFLFLFIYFFFFINSIAHNYTQYPFSTQNIKDYENLQSVYLDSVFNPLLRSQDFLQEGWRLERDENGEYQIKGVVYNEMKGAFSDAGSLLQTRTEQNLFPGTTYENESGGDPAKITDLTHEQLVNFHKKHYHPSNSRIFSYGSFPLEPQLERVSVALSKYSISNPPVVNHIVKPYGVKSVSENGPVEGASHPDLQTKYSVSFLMNDVSDVYQTFKNQIFSSLLISGTSAPMHQSLIDSGLGPDFSANTGYNTQSKISSLTIGLQGINRDKIDSVDKAIKDTISQVYETGFDSRRVDAVIHSIELGFKHKTAHFGMSLMQMISSGWFLGIDPLTMLELESNLERLRSDLSKKLPFSETIEKYLLNPSHELKFTMMADPDFSKIQASDEALLLSSKVEALSKDQMNVIDEQASSLASAQKEDEDLSCLPTLNLDDVTKSVDRYAIDINSISNTPVQWRVTSTNGISYLKIANGIQSLPSDLVPYLPLFCDSLTYLGTKDRLMPEIETDINLYTGGVRVSPFVSTDFNDTGCAEIGIILSSNCLDANIPQMYKLVKELVFETDFDKQDRLRTLITASASGVYNSIANSGHSYARTLAGSTLSPEVRFSNMVSGIGQAKFITGLANIISEAQNIDDVVTNLKRIRDHLIKSESIGVAITTMPDSVGPNTESASLILDELDNSKEAEKLTKISNSSQSILNQDPSSKKYLCPMPFASNFAARSILTVPYTHQDSAALQVLAKILTQNFLHREIRESNGAYGGGAVFSPLAGIFGFFSYRDPNPLFSIESFGRSVEFAVNTEFDERQMSEAKLSLFKDLDSPISVSQEGMQFFNHGITDDMRQKRRDQLFAVTVDDLKRVAKQYLVVSEGQLSSDAIIGNSDGLSLFEFEQVLEEDSGISKPLQWTKISLE
ncbi:Presequence protease, mitochondrial [Smittium mucronatum]|uniref:Presequence protease, mitochondrial n=1 Tax=Smittium mucronatum TaxID=133383 RepID=A0A1R0GPS4_9FUNG|nr:Presequence protease, mitochondrial [Smittium mucronatum]